MKHWIGSILFLLVGLGLGLVFINPNFLASPYSKIAEQLVLASLVLLLTALVLWTSNENKKLKAQLGEHKK